MGMIPATFACSACYGSGTVDSPTTKGIGFLVFFLLGTTGLVLGGIVAFFFHLRKMAKLAESSPSMAHAQHTPIWHLQHAHAASGLHSHSESDSIFSSGRHRRHRTFFNRDRGSQT
jgi:hypothetical protein